MQSNILIILQNEKCFRKVNMMLKNYYNVIYKKLITDTVLNISNFDISLCILEANKLTSSWLEIIGFIYRMKNVPILFLSEEKCREKIIKEKIKVLDKGCDEYLDYRQSGEEIVASVKALIRQKNKYINTCDEFNTNGLKIYSSSRKIFYEETEIHFTKLEFDIIYYLASNQNRAITYKELYEAVWHKEYLCDDMNIMAHIHRIRKKLEPDPKHPEIIQNVYGIGYRFVS